MINCSTNKIIPRTVQGKLFLKVQGSMKTLCSSSLVCHAQGFGFNDRGSTFEKPCLLGADGIHLSMRSKSSLANKLAQLLREL